MGLLKSVDNVPDIDYYEYRDHEFYLKYKYRAKFNFLGAQFLYYTKTVNQWRNRVNNTDNHWFSTRMSRFEKDQVLENQPIVEKFLDFKNTISKDKITIRIEGTFISVFSNDLSLLVGIKNWSPTLTVRITECILGEYSGVKYFVREPKNNYRVYLKSKRVPQDIVEQLKDLLSRQSTLIPSKGLTKWLTHQHRNAWRNRYCSSSYFIDYNDEAIISYLALCHGEILGKKYQLKKREE